MAVGFLLWVRSSLYHQISCHGAVLFLIATRQDSAHGPAFTLGSFHKMYVAVKVIGKSF